MEFLEFLRRSPRAVYSVFGAFLGWVVLLGPFYPRQDPWYAGITQVDQPPTTTIAALASLVGWDSAAALVTDQVAPWFADRPNIAYLSVVPIMVLVYLIVVDEEHLGDLPAATYWCLAAVLAQVAPVALIWDYPGASSGEFHFNWVWHGLLLIFLMAALAGVRADVNDWDRSDFIFPHTVFFRLRKLMVSGLIAPLVLMRPLFSGKD